MQDRKRVCCNCGNNKRIPRENGMIDHNECVIDGHRIDYIECMTGWCRRWRKNNDNN